MTTIVFAIWIGLQMAVMEIKDDAKAPPRVEPGLQEQKSVDSPDAKLLFDYRDLLLQRLLEQEMERNKNWKRLMAQKRLCVGIVDLNDDRGIRFASINGNEMMYAASLPKIAVLLSMEEAMENGQIVSNTKIEQDMRLMISKSNNQATTRLIDLLGYERIETTVKKYGYYDQEQGGGLWVGKRYAAGGPTNREPLKNLSHAATVDQVCRFYYELWERQLVSKQRSEHMLQMLEDPELHHKFVYTIDQMVPDAKIYRKSGTWKTWHSDSAMLISADRKYIMVALVNDGSGEQIIRDLVLAFDKAISQP